MIVTVYTTDVKIDYKKSPFFKWLYKLDEQTRAIIRNRIDRLKIGNFGDGDPVGEGVSELRIHYGPGYRVYFGQRGNIKVILLAAGNKSTQARDIEKAKLYWIDYNSTPREVPYEEKKR
jgi:putative addiction module killer protein